MCENGAGPVKFVRGIEVGNTFKLGEKYARAMDLFYRSNNELKPVQMGSYGIGIARCMAAIVEQHHNEQGISGLNIWSIQVAIVIINRKMKSRLKLPNNYMKH